MKAKTGASFTFAKGTVARKIAVETRTTLSASRRATRPAGSVERNSLPESDMRLSDYGESPASPMDNFLTARGRNIRPGDGSEWPPPGPEGGRRGAGSVTAI